MHKRALFEGRGNLTSTAQALDWQPSQRVTLCQAGGLFGGEGGIRTPVTLSGKLDFESSAFNRARPPLRFSGIALLYPETGEKICKQGCGFIGEHASGNRQLMVESLIF